MLSFELSDGVWPTMVTPFTESGEVDYEAVDPLVDWYLAAGVDGLFAVCQSSEMFFLALDERVALTERIVKRVDGRCGVITSGHTAEELSEQAEEIDAMAETGAQAVVLVTNRLNSRNEGDQSWIRNAEKLLAKIDAAVPLGLYECPFPYKRLLSRELLGWVTQTDRFFFLKDTSCDRSIVAERANCCTGESLKLYNANSSTLLYSLGLGYSGYSGVMANFHPELYVRLCRNWQQQPREAERLLSLLSIAAGIEGHGYPKNAKRYLRALGVPITDYCRSRSEPLLDYWELELQHLDELTQCASEQFSLEAPR